MKIKRMTINKVLTAAVLAALFSAAWGTLPVSAEEAAGGAASLQTPAETALSETSGSASVQPGSPAEQPSAEETDTIDHSAESKPIQNIFLKEGEGRPGTEIPYYISEGPGQGKRRQRKRVCQSFSGTAEIQYRV